MILPGAGAVREAASSGLPQRLNSETGRGDSKVLELCVANGYSLRERARMKVILTISDPARDE